MEEVIGLNFTLWKPEENPYAVIKGLAVGLYGPSANELHYISVGGAVVEAGSLLSGISVGGLAVVCNGNVSGTTVAGLANVADGYMSGINASFANLRKALDAAAAVEAAVLGISTSSFRISVLVEERHLPELTRGFHRALVEDR